MFTNVGSQNINTFKFSKHLIHTECEHKARNLSPCNIFHGVFSGIPSPSPQLLMGDSYTAAIMERLSAERMSAERMTAERLQAERMAFTHDPMVRLQMTGLPGAAAAAAAAAASSQQAHTHTHAHSHTHLHLHQPDGVPPGPGPPPPLHPLLPPHLLPPGE